MVTSWLFLQKLDMTIFSSSATAKYYFLKMIISYSQ